jgi:hypothetical protein
MAPKYVDRLDRLVALAAETRRAIVHWYSGPMEAFRELEGIGRNLLSG